MKIEILKPEQLQYKDSKEFLDRQQNIDTLIALARVGEVVKGGSEVETEIVKTIRKILDKL